MRACTTSRRSLGAAPMDTSVEAASDTPWALCSGDASCGVSTEQQLVGGALAAGCPVVAPGAQLWWPGAGCPAVAPGAQPWLPPPPGPPGMVWGLPMLPLVRVPGIVLPACAAGAPHLGAGVPAVAGSAAWGAWPGGGCVP